MNETESRNKKTMDLDNLSTIDILKIMNQEDQTVPETIANLLPKISEIVEAATDTFKNHGRLIYVGAGTSGRLGVLDAAECVPTFGVSPEMVQGLIAGGNEAMFRAIEGAEDSFELGEEELKARHLTVNDIVIGVAASGRTPYVIGALKYARALGAKTVAISCNKDAKISPYAELSLEIVVGPEVLTGSTRLKAGSAQKMVLNMITTASMVKIGKVYSNLMVDVLPMNEKLVERAKRIIMEATGVEYSTAEKFYITSGHQPKLAIVMILGDVDLTKAQLALENSEGFVKKALDWIKQAN